MTVFDPFTLSPFLFPPSAAEPGGCGVLGGSGTLTVPGANAVHNGRNNHFATIVTTGPAFLVLDVSEGFLPYGDIGVNTDGGYNFAITATDTGFWLIPLPLAATYYVWGKFNTTYSPGITGAATYEWYYPSGSGTALSIPGTSDTWGGFDANRIGEFTVGQAAVFVTFTSNASAGAYLAVLNNDETDPSIFYPPEIVAGTYVFVVHQGNPPTRTDPPELYRIIVQLSDAEYHADLVGPGFYEVCSF